MNTIAIVAFLLFLRSNTVLSRALSEKREIPACDKAPVPDEMNLCRASFPVYYYDKTQNKCVDFIYGGCHGTENLFGSLGDCQKQCIVSNSIEKKNFDESITSESSTFTSNSIVAVNRNSDTVTESNIINDRTYDINDNQNIEVFQIRLDETSAESHFQYNEKPNDPNVRNKLSFYFFQ